MSIAPDVYDLIPYPGFAYANTHPDSLAVMALLHGLEPASVSHCRVLEIGCNEGANLIPMAYVLPGSEFVGFDLASVPVARGQQRIEQLGLTNISMFQADIMEVGEALGTFDYILAHGVYAWVPEPVRDAVLALCQRHLAQNGIAFLSYNALPGGHIRNLAADILRQCLHDVDNPAPGITQGIDLLQTLAEARPEGDPLRGLMQQEAARLRKRGPDVIFHDELAPGHRPVSVTVFVTHAAAHGLQYVSEATLPASTDPCFQPQTVAFAKAKAAGDLLAEEQILDFARMRKYRETLLCHAGRPITADLRLDRLARLLFASPAIASPGEGPVLRIYTLPGEMRMQSEHPATVALMDYLIAAWPESVSYVELAQFLNTQAHLTELELATLILRLTISKFIELHTWQAPVSRHIADHPVASTLAKLDAATRGQTTTLLHTSLDLADPLIRRFLTLLDGTRDRASLVRTLMQEHPELPESTFSEGVEATLTMLHRAGALLAEAAREQG